jgi:hypothetical protein
MGQKVLSHRVAGFDQLQRIEDHDDTIFAQVNPVNEAAIERAKIAGAFDDLVGRDGADVADPVNAEADPFRSKAEDQVAPVCAGLKRFCP